MSETKVQEPKMQTRFGFLWRELTRVAEGDPDRHDAAEIRRLLDDVRAYLAADREEILRPEYTPYFLKFNLRNAARAVLAKATGRSWEPDVAAFVESIPAEEVLPNGARFSSDFVSVPSVNWTPALAHLVGLPDVQGVEVGSFEGRSSLWFLSNVLTHRTSRLTCIDTFDFGGQGREDIESDKLQSRFDLNVAAAGETQRVTKIFGMSQQALRMLPLDHYHFAYIDGSHLTADVLEDTVLMWRLLRPDGVLILDDYGYFRLHPEATTVRPDLAIDAFMTCFAGQWTEVHRGYQMILRKTRAA